MPIAYKYDFSQDSMIKGPLLARMREAAPVREEISFSQLMQQESRSRPSLPKKPPAPQPQKKKDEPTL